MTGITTTTWGEVEFGTVVRDKNDRLWIVGSADGEHLILTPAHGRGDPVTLRSRPPADTPVDIYVATEQEAIELASTDLGGRILRDIEEREHTIARTLTWRVDPVARKITALRDHIDWLHGVNVDDVLRRHNGTPTKPSDAATKKASVEELCQAHDEMHDRPDLWPHSWAHFHAPIGGTA